MVKTGLVTVAAYTLVRPMSGHAEALRDGKMKRALQLQELAALKADIDKGLADAVAGRVKKFNAGRIIERGRKLLAGRSPSTRPTRRSRPRGDLGLPGKGGFRRRGERLG